MAQNKKHLIIYNPNAGRRRKKTLDAVLMALRENDVAYELYPTERAGHATDIARLYADSPDVISIIAAGGDGTINEVINGMGKSVKPLGIIPLGTANVLAKEIGLKITVNEISATLMNFKTAKIYLAQINGQYFSLMASVGFDALAVKNVNLAFKKKFGEVAYFFAFLKEVFFSENIEYFLTENDRNHSAYGVIITNGKYYGGKYICAPNASIYDDTLYAILFKRAGALNVIKYFMALIMGRIERVTDVEIIPLSVASLSSNVTAPVQIDGDHFGNLQVSISISKRPINIIVP